MVDWGRNTNFFLGELGFGADGSGVKSQRFRRANKQKQSIWSLAA